MSAAKQTRRPTRSEAKLERLSTALDARNRLSLSDDDFVAHARALIHAENVLLDMSVECGMPIGGDEIAFASRVVTKWLCAA